MINPKEYTIKRFEINAVWDGNKCYHHFGIVPSLASMYGNKPEDIETITMKISEDQSIPVPNGEYREADYWGWINADEDELSTMLFAQRFLLDMCFPTGIAGSEEAGRGKAYRLEIVKTIITL